MPSAIVVGLHVTVNNVTTHGVAENCFHSKFISPGKKNAFCSSRKVSDTLTYFNQICICLKRYLQKSPISNFTEIYPVGVALVHADRRTD